MIWVPNQLVGAPAGTDVTIDCHTEAYPRAISYWVSTNLILFTIRENQKLGQLSHSTVVDTSFTLFFTAV